VLTPPRAFIDTSALRHNLARVREHAPRSRVMAVIKADAYGHGLETAAAALAEADGLAVARVEEALALRAAGSRQRILLLEGVSRADQLAVAAREDFDVMIHSHEQLVMLEQRPQATKLRTWLKVDTGMNRLGFRVEEFADALARLARISGIAPDPTIVTHLASADEVEDPKTQQQLDAFEAATAGVPGERSVANSAGILAWPAARRDWVRPGLMLYGASPFPGGTGADIGLRPVMTFQSEVIAVKTVEAGETVGYGGAWRAARRTCMAVIAVGYGDGYPRSARAGTPLLIDGQRAPLIGRVSMDMITADVTGMPAVRVGAPVELWGGMLPVEEIARWADRIPYELTCGVTQRAPRVFRQAPA
jgi:alanine racemase